MKMQEKKYLKKSEKEILRKQLELLSEDSAEATGNELANLSAAMCAIDQRLSLHLTLTSVKKFIVFTQLFIGFIVLLKKFCRR